MHFLPGRTVYSMEARWRRIAKHSENIEPVQMQVPKANSKNRNDLLEKIAEQRRKKKREAMQKEYEREK